MNRLFKQPSSVCAMLTGDMKFTCFLPYQLLIPALHGSRRFSQIHRLTKSFVLNTGATIPAVGFGTLSDPEAQEQAVSQALHKGYRMIDTARIYNNECQVGKGIRKSGIPREEIFIITKIWNNDHHPDDVEGALDDSLADLNTHYVDLLLIHFPCPFARGSERFPRNPQNEQIILGNTTFVQTWKAMERLLAQTDKVKAIGVANFSQSEIAQILEQCSIVPAVHQMECHPYLQQPVFNEWLRRKKIHVIQYSPLGNMNNEYRIQGWSKSIAHEMTRIIDHPILKELGSKYGKSAVQIALAWGVNSGRSIIPKGVQDWEIEENIDVGFSMDARDMQEISHLDAKARFNDPSKDFQWELYADLDGGGEGMEGRTY